MQYKCFKIRIKKISWKAEQNDTEMGNRRQNRGSTQEFQDMNKRNYRKRESRKRIGENIRKITQENFPEMKNMSSQIKQCQAQ